MNDRIRFSKYSGCGNEFICIDNRQRVIDVETSGISSIICHQGLADGTILLETSHSADFRMRIFNADGSEAEMCGNGMRCLARYLNDLGIPGKQFCIETMHHRLVVTLAGELITAQMPLPTNMTWSIPLVIDGKEHAVHYLDTGVPHAVVFVDDIQKQGIMELGAKIRHHPYFSKGANVNFAEMTPLGIAVRTYERGVEGETMSCGTGAAAAAVAAGIFLERNSPISIQARSGEHLTVTFEKQKQTISRLEITGPAVKIGEGTVVLG